MMKGTDKYGQDEEDVTRRRHHLMARAFDELKCG